MRALLFAAVLAAAAPAPLALAQTAPAGPSKNLADAPAATYTVDGSHASVVWKVSHLGLSAYTARFDKISGALAFDPKAVTQSKVEISIDPLSASTGLPNFDKKIRDDYFQSAKFPAITFKSAKVEQSGPTTGKVTGDLTFLGVTKPVTLDVTWNGGLFSKFGGGYALGFSAKGAIKRSDFGFSAMIPTVGDQVDLAIEIEFINRPAAPAGKP
jgi:polyisoprenoid-binding protein YceI